MPVKYFKSLAYRLAGLRQDSNYFLDSVTGVIHIGANLGQERSLYSSKNLAVLWVEPIPAIYERLVENLSCFPGQRAAQALLLDREGVTVQLNIASNEGASSSVFLFKHHQSIWPDVEFVDQLLMESQTLPGLLRQLQLQMSDYQALVMDTQGSELLILKGSLSILDQFKYGLLRKVSLTSAGNTGESPPACRMILRRKQADHSTPPHGSGRLLYGPEAAVASRPKGQKEALGACRGS